jgi:membrane-bound serine protease (ClpP class)
MSGLRHPAAAAFRMLLGIIVGAACAWSLALTALVASAAPSHAPPKPPAATYRHAALIHLTGEVTPWLEGYLDRKLKAAQAAGADLIIVQIDSPGGYLEESGRMAERLRELSAAHTVAYIPREALSGAAYISLGTDEILMRPTARIGDVGIIFLDKDFMFHYAPEKYKSALVEALRILAIDKGRPPALVEAMVDMDCEVFQVKDQRTGEIEFLSEKEIESSPDKDQLEKLGLVLESQKGRFLTVSGMRAVELKLAAATVESTADMKQRFAVAGGWREYNVDNVDRAVYVLNLWWVTVLLLVCGMVGLFKELAAPGTFLGISIAALCFALFFWSRYLSGTSGMLELLLFIAGVAFLAMELFVLPGFGVAGMLGIGLLLGSLVLACQNFVVPHTERQLFTLSASVLLVAGSSLTFMVVAAVMLSYLGSLPLLNRLKLAPPTSAEPVAPDSESSLLAAVLPVQVGDVGLADGPLRPAGRARFGGTPLDVVSDGHFIDRGATIRVVEVSPHRIVVQEVAAETPPPDRERKSS